ncbi:oligosaccharide flippase family protein [Pigmentiphaga sp. CHJ604]|uniref:oligosaccharide flippase family protein n=1 Tax=Pigmentiphaga sp. CHJ604 TaxID=3081984 RepID=UPI0030D0E5EE
MIAFSQFWKKVLTVTAGTLGAQLLLLATLPLLTRSLSQADVGSYLFAISVAAVTVVLASARLDMAIFLEDNQKDVFRILGTIFITSLTVSILVGFSIFFIGNFPFSKNLDSLKGSSTAIAATTFSLSIFTGIQAVLSYQSRFSTLSFLKFFQALIISLLLILAAMIFSTAKSLILAHAIGMLASVALGVLLLRKFSSGSLRLPRAAEMREVFRKHRRFPIFSMPADLINVLSSQLPVFLLGAKFGTAAVAFYALTTRVMVAPISLLAGSILPVFKEQASSEYRENGSCLTAYLKMLKTLTLISIIPASLAFYLLEPTFSLLFGAEWMEAGTLAKTMLPLYCLKFIASPLSYTLYVGNWQSYDLIWQSVLLFFTAMIFSFAENLHAAVLYYTIAYSFLYIIYLGMSYRCAKGKK